MSKITAEHLARQAVVYVRQSTQDQVQHNHESRRRQYGLVDRARGEALQRLGDECHVGVELRGATRALALALHPCLAQHPLDGGVMDPELGGDGPYPPVLDEVVAQDLRLELVVGRHRARRSVPGATPSASSYRRATPLPTDELADRARAEVAVHRELAGLGDIGGLASRIATR